MRRMGIIVAVGVVTLAAGVLADTVTIDAVGRGRYADDGRHILNNTYTGRIGGNFSRSYFVFDLSGLAAATAAAGAELRLEVEQWFGDSGSAWSVALYDVSSPYDTLSAAHAAGSEPGQLIFADLGTGSSYGGASVASGAVGTIISFTLSSQAIADINAAYGGLLVIGASVENVAPAGVNEGVRFSSTTESRVHQLVLTTAQDGPDADAAVIPLPGALWGGLVLMGAAAGMKRVRGGGRRGG